jgi:thiosulfate/3-mercaptopyruvate sulfurtransferase
VVAIGPAGDNGCSAPVSSRESFGSRFRHGPDYLVGMDQVRGLVHRDDGVLVSIRSWGEFTGQTSGYSYICARGEIPGARWGRAGRDGDVQSMSDFHHADGTMKPAAEIQAFWKAAGIHPAKPATFIAVRDGAASLAFFYAWVMNWERISVYDGGWLNGVRIPAMPLRDMLLAGLGIALTPDSGDGPAGG